MTRVRLFRKGPTAAASALDPVGHQPLSPFAIFCPITKCRQEDLATSASSTKSREADMLVVIDLGSCS